MNIVPISLLGERVKLTPLEAAHIQALYEAGCYPEIWTYMPWRIAQVADMSQLVQEALLDKQEGREFPFVIIDRQTDRIVGSTRFLDISVANRNLEIGGTWLSPHVWRTRINTECKYLLLRHCFETLQTLRVQFKTDARNMRSQRAIERIGATQEGVLRRHRILPDGYVRDSVYYSVLREEWPEIKARLDAKLR